MIGLPTIASSRISSRLMPALIASWATRPFSALRTAAVISPAPSGCIIAYETRLIRSSPKRICGFITPWLARTEPSDRSARWPAIVVEPTSIATPYALSWRPGQIAVSVRPSWTATVTPNEPFSSAGWSVADHGEVGLEVGQAPLALERLEQPDEVARRRRELGRDDLDVVEPDDRIDVEVAHVERPCGRPGGRPGSPAARR